MIDRLKTAFYTRKLGGENAALIVRIEREITGLPSRLVSEEWLEALWELPSEAWLDCVALRRQQARILEEREAVVAAISEKDHCRRVVEYAKESLLEIERAKLGAAETAAKEAVRKFEALKAKAVESEIRYRDPAQAFQERFPNSVPAPNEIPAPARAVGGQLPKLDWDRWTEALPIEVRADAIRARELYEMRSEIHRQLLAEVTKRHQSSLLERSVEEICELEEQIFELHREENRLGGPFMEIAEFLFEEYGEPEQIA